MAHLIPFKQPDKPHNTGYLRCLDCAYEGAYVTPEDRTIHDCPQCGLAKAVWVGLFEPYGAARWVCNTCKNDLFYILPNGWQCCLCGKVSDREGNPA